MEKAEPMNYNDVSINTSNEKSMNEKWTQEMDRILIDAFVHQMDLGNRVNGTFTTTAYDNVVNELSAQLNRHMKKQIIKNRLKTIKRNFNDSYDIFKGGMSGFSWNPQTNMWGAEPEVWKELIEAKPQAKKWMTTPIANYEKLVQLYGKDRASGVGAETAKEKARRWSEVGVEDINNIDDIDEMVRNDDVLLEDFFPNNTDVHNNLTEPTVEENSNKRRKRRVSSSSNIIELQAKSLEKIATAVTTSNEILYQKNEILDKSVAILRSDTKVFEELVNLGFDENTTLVPAYDFLIGDSKRMRMFFGCQSKKHYNFLINLMRREGVPLE